MVASPCAGCCRRRASATSGRSSSSTHFGPVEEQPGVNHDVRPHPHIGLATVTYLFDGAMMHRDSLGTEQLIEPGAINWMSAGRSIVHSERRPAELRDRRHVNHDLQLWVALPGEHEEDEPSFSHTPAHAIPQIGFGGATVRVLVGEAFGDGPRHIWWNFVPPARTASFRLRTTGKRNAWAGCRATTN